MTAQFRSDCDWIFSLFKHILDQAAAVIQHCYIYVIFKVPISVMTDAVGDAFRYTCVHVCYITCAKGEGLRVSHSPLTT